MSFSLPIIASKVGVIPEVIQDGKGYDFNNLGTYYYKNFINKGIDISIKQELVNNLKKYELENILGEGSFGKVFEASINDEKSNDSTLALK